MVSFGYIYSVLSVCFVVFVRRKGGLSSFAFKLFTTPNEKSNDEIMKLQFGRTQLFISILLAATST